MMRFRSWLRIRTDWRVVTSRWCRRRRGCEPGEGATLSRRGGPRLTGTRRPSPGSSVTRRTCSAEDWSKARSHRTTSRRFSRTGASIDGNMDKPLFYDNVLRKIDRCRENLYLRIIVIEIVCMKRKCNWNKCCTVSTFWCRIPRL